MAKTFAELTPEEKKEKLEQAIESLRPEAKEFVEQIMSDPLKTTKDNYGKVMSFLSMGFTRMQQYCFLQAMVREGYPQNTANDIARIQGLK